MCRRQTPTFRMAASVAFTLLLGISVFSQSLPTQSRACWEKLMYEDVGTVIKETSAELVKDPGNATALRMRSSAFYRMGDPVKGKADAVAALALLTSPAKAEEFEAKCYAERRLEKDDEALLDCTKAIELDPKFAWAYYNRGKAHEFKKLYPQAVADYTKAIELSPAFQDAYNGRGNVHGLNREFDKAIADQTKAIGLDPKRASEYFSRGYWYLQKGEYDRVISDLNRSIEIDPKIANAYINRGSAYIGKRQYDLAIADHTKAIELDPKGRGWYFRGIAYLDKNDYDKAITDLTKAIELAPQAADATTQEAAAIILRNKLFWRRRTLQKL